MASGIGKVRLFNTTPSKFTLAARRVFLLASPNRVERNWPPRQPPRRLASDRYAWRRFPVGGAQHERRHISERFTHFVRPLPQRVCDRGESQLGGGLAAWHEP